MSREERFFSTKKNNFFIINSDNRDLNYDLYFKTGKKLINKYDDYTSQNTRQLNLKETIDLIKPLIKEYNLD